MSGANCTIFGCSAPQKLKIIIFKVPTKYEEYSTDWGKKNVDAIIRNRVIGKGLQSQINNRTVFVYEGHYPVCKMLRRKFIVCIQTNR